MTILSKNVHNLPISDVRSMIRQLRAEPAVDGLDEMQIICGESGLSAIRQGCIFYLDPCCTSGEFL